MIEFYFLLASYNNLIELWADTSFNLSATKLHLLNLAYELQQTHHN